MCALFFYTFIYGNSPKDTRFAVTFRTRAQVLKIPLGIFHNKWREAPLFLRKKNYDRIFLTVMKRVF